MANEKTELIKDETSEKIVAVTEKLVLEGGAHTVTVRKILRELNATNRVFYNRFHNLDEVLRIVYANTVEKVRAGFSSEYDGKQDFFEYVIDTVTQSLILSYEVKRHFNQYVFENDSASDNNFEWYAETIKKLFAYAREHDLIMEVDEEALTYAIWCFCRGYNADAVTRLSKEEAVEKFRYSFGVLLDGIKKRA